MIRSIFASASLIACLISFVALSGSLTLADDEKIRFDMPLNGGALKDPLLEMVMPPRGSPDRVSFQPDGIYVRQVEEIAGQPSAGCGLKFINNAAGDFKFEIEFECKELQPPKSGWGQGMMIRILTDDPEASVMAVGCVANQQHPRCLWIQMPRGNGQQPMYGSQPTDFKKGVWIVERKADELICSIKTKDEPLAEKIRLPCTTSSLNGVQFWFTRQAAGNTKSEFVLKHLKFECDRFFTYQAPGKSGWSWRTILLLTLATCWGGYGIYRFANRRS